MSLFAVCLPVSICFAESENLALNKPYSMDPEPNYRYCTEPGDKIQLTDGMHAIGWTQKGMVGWQGQAKASITIDLGKIYPIDRVAVRATEGTKVSIAYPLAALVLVSEDGKQFYYCGNAIVESTQKNPEEGKYRYVSMHRFVSPQLATKGRYVKLIIAASSTTMFVDEIEVLKGDRKLHDIVYDTKNAESGLDTDALIAREKGAVDTNVRPEALPHVTRRKILMLDDRNIHKLDNTRIVVNQPTRHPDNPIFSGHNGFWDTSKGQSGGVSNIIWDEEDKLFKAWYSFGVSQGNNIKPVKEWRVSAYATSTDGIHWDKPDLGQVEWQGSRHNNLIKGQNYGVIFKDPSEAIAQRRWKTAFTVDGSNGGMFRPICIAYSPDGISWTVPKLQYSRTPDATINRPINPIIPEGTDHIIGHSWYWDPYIRSYVGLMRPVWNVPRRICMAESSDFINWTLRRVILEPDEHDPPQNQEFHSMHVMRYENYWIGFMDVLHTEHEGWYAFHEIESDQPKWRQTVSVQLTYSRDGRNWFRCGDRQTFLAPADPGGDVFDASCIFVKNGPFTKDDKIWIYYEGNPDRFSHLEYKRKGLGRATGLAQLRLDGFVSIDANEKQGTYITTDTLDVIPTYIKLNASTKEGGSIRVEVLDPFSRPIKDFTLDQAVPFKGDELRGEVAWKHGQRLSDITGDLLGGIRLKFYMNRAKLYSFTLIREEPCLGACGLQHELP